MATDLTTIFGNEIKVALKPRRPQRQYYGFAGAHGVTAMHMGSRGFTLVVTGTLRAASRPLLESAIAAIESWLWAGAADYSFYGCLYSNVVWDQFEILTSPDGKAYGLTSTGWVRCNFRMIGRGLL